MDVGLDVAGRVIVDHQVDAPAEREGVGVWGFNFRLETYEDEEAEQRFWD